MKKMYCATTLAMCLTLTALRAFSPMPVPALNFQNWGTTDYFLQIEGVKGESTHAKHKGWIELEAITLPSDMNKKNASFVAKKRIDISSKSLADALAKRTVFSTVRLHQRSPQNPDLFIVFELHDVTIKAIKKDISSDIVPVEEVSFSYLRLVKA